MSKKKRKNKKVMVRRAVEVMHLNRNQETGKYYLSRKGYFFQISAHTKDSKVKKFYGRMIPLGQIVKVQTNYGWKPAVVVKNMEVTGDFALKAVKRLKRVTRITDKKLADIAPYLVDEMNDYIQNTNHQ